MSREIFMHFLVHDLRQPEELGADFETGFLGCTRIDLEPNSILRPVKICDSARCREAFLVRDAKDARSAESGDGGAVRLLEVATDEEDVATAGLHEIGGLIDPHRPLSNLFAGHGLGNYVAEARRTQHADHHGRVASIEGILRPLDVARKIEQKGGHDLVFGLRNPLWNNKEECDQRRDEDAQWRRASSSAEDPSDLARSAHA